MPAVKIVKAMPEAPGMSAVEVEEFLSRQKTPLRLGTSDSNGDPQIHPVWYHYASDRLYLMSDRNVRKVRNVRKNSTVYFSVDTDAAPNKGVKGKGSAKIISESAKTVPIAEKIVTKYLGDAKNGYGKGLMDSVRNGSEVVVEITPRYYSVWDYSKMQQVARLKTLMNSRPPVFGISITPYSNNIDDIFKLAEIESLEGNKTMRLKCDLKDSRPVNLCPKSSLKEETRL